jgi:hypothetical protein
MHIYILRCLIYLPLIPLIILVTQFFIFLVMINWMRKKENPKLGSSREIQVCFYAFNIFLFYSFLYSGALGLIASKH